MNTDTIAAIATAPGRGAIGILRLSGPEATAIAVKLVGELPPPREAALRSIRDASGVAIDHGIVIYFRAPHSFTGEDVVELQGHGGSVVLQLLLQAACAHGARAARPGEFSERAFLNGRLDLAQAEAIADLIDAGSAAAARAATRSLEGEFSRRAGDIVNTLIKLRADLEAALDFADEDVPWLSPQTLDTRVASLAAKVTSLLNEAGQGRRLREGMTVAIAGRPNVGKSTLLNRLAGAEVAIVSPIAGTTRDILREHIVVDGLPLTIVDTAGLRDTDDPVEREGVTRARAAVAKAELALFVVDDRGGVGAEEEALLAQLPPKLPRLVIRNKCDLSGQRPGPVDGAGRDEELRLSAQSGAGVDMLRQRLKTAAGLTMDTASLFSARTRHIDALRRAQTHIDAAGRQARSSASAEVVAEELRLAQQALEEISGRFTADDLLGRIFASFCLGK